MLRTTFSKSASAAAAYYTSGLTRADYYSHGNAIEGQWFGKAAAMLGLSGRVTKEDFASLADGFDPRTGAKVVQRVKANRRAGMDFTFNANKSTTLFFEYTGDQRILEAHENAVKETALDIEAALQTQSYDADGKKVWADTGNAAWAMFTDFETRPTDFGSNDDEDITDPHLHTHAFCFAPTYLEERDRWQVAEFGSIVANRPYYEALYHARLAKNMEALGYPTTPTQGGRWWEIAGPSRRLIDKFSNRTSEIKAHAKKRGITHPQTLDTLGARTRRKKSKAKICLEDLRAEWRSRLTDEDIAELEDAGKSAGGDVVTASEALAFALEKCLERSSVVEHKRLLTEALRYGIGHVAPEDLMAEFERVQSDGGILSREVTSAPAKSGRRTYLTTPEVAAEEAAMLDSVRSSARTCKPLKTMPHIFTPVVNEDGSAFELSDEQQDAVRAILTSRDRITSLRGVAGAGKTTALQELVGAVEGKDAVPGPAPYRRVFTVAPSSDAVGVLKNEGFDASTLQSLLISEERQAELKGGVLLVDEAGLVSVGQMRQIFDIADRHDARVILVGDEYQHTAVERSDVNVLRILRQHAGLDTAAITRIQRQKSAPYREAVEALSRGNVAGGFDRLGAMGAVLEIADDAQRYGKLADDYLAITGKSRRLGFQRKPKEALIVAPTHREGDDVTAVVRERLKAARALGRKDRTVMRLRSLGWTGAERKHAGLYEEGMVVQFVRRGGGFQSGDRLTVTGRDEQGRVMAITDQGRSVALPLDHAARFQVYRKGTLELAAGDIVRMAQNGHDLNGHTLTNGNRYTVEGFTPEGHIRFDNGFIVDKAYGQLDHGYVLTSHAAQGKTVDHVLIAESSASFAAAGPDQFYVSASRGKTGITVYTDDREALRDAVAHAPLALSVTDLMHRKTDAPRSSNAPRSAPVEDPDRPRRMRAYQWIMNIHQQRRRENAQDVADAAPTRSAAWMGRLRGVWERFTAPPPVPPPSPPPHHWRPAL